MTTTSLFFPSDIPNISDTVTALAQLQEERRLLRVAIQRVHVMLRMSDWLWKQPNVWSDSFETLDNSREEFGDFFRDELSDLHVALNSLVTVPVTIDDLWFMGSSSYRAAQVIKKQVEKEASDADATVPQDPGSLGWKRALDLIGGQDNTLETRRVAAEEAFVAALIAGHAGIQARRWSTTVASCVIAELPYAGLVIACEALEAVEIAHIKHSLRSDIDTILKGAI